MSPARIATVVSLLTLLLLLNSITDLVYALDTTPKGYVLQVGINEYKMRPLYGAINDLDDFKVVLVNRFRISDNASSYLRLENKRATKKAILEAFKTHLVEHAKKEPDALYVFQYSGHGIQVPDDDEIKDEGDGFDEALVPYDVNSRVFSEPEGLRKALITDDELSKLMLELTKYTSKALFVVDSCNSGTGFRGDDVPHSRLLKLSDFGLKDRQAKTGSGAPSSFFRSSELMNASSRYVAISGSDSFHEAQEHYGPSRRVNGLMTSKLVQILKSCPASLTYRQVGELLRASVSSQSPQNPQLEGNIDRPVFGDNTGMSIHGFAVKDIDGDLVTIDAGSSLGVTKGTVISFYGSSDQTKSNDDFSPLASGIVAEAFPFSSRVKLSSGINGSALSNSLAKISGLDEAASRYSVSIDGSVAAVWGGDFSKGLESKLEQNPFLSFQSLPRDKENHPQQLLIVASRTDKSKFEIRDHATERVISLNVDLSRTKSETIGSIAQACEKLARQNFVRNLFNLSSRLAGKVEISLRKARMKGRDLVVDSPVLNAHSSSPSIEIGDIIQLGIKNSSSRPLYLAVLSLDTSGGIAQVYPEAAGAEEEIAPAGTKVLYRKIGGPPGLQTYKVFASAQAIDVGSLTQSNIRGDKMKFSKFDEEWFVSNVDMRIMDCHH